MLAACREEVSGWNTLSETEKEWVRQQATAKCLETNGGAYTQFKNKTREIFTSENYERTKGFVHQFKVGTTVARTLVYRIYKRDVNNTAVYFYVTETDNLGNLKNYFVKSDLSQSDEMISDLLADHCASDKIYLASAPTYGPLSITYSYTKYPAEGGSKVYSDSYSFDHSNFAFMGYLDLTRSIVTKDVNGSTTGTESFTSTLELTSYATELSTDYTTLTQKFCEFDYETGTTYRLSQDMIGFKMDTNACPTALPGTWNLTF